MSSSVHICAALCFGSLGLAYAVTPPGSTATREDCWDAYCQNVKNCISSTENPQLLRQCLNLRITSLSDCLQSVENWVPYGSWEPALAGDLTLDWCRLAFDARVTRCMGLPASDNETCFDSIPAEWQPDQIDLLRSWCLSAAQLEYNICKAKAIESDPIAMQSFASGKAILENKIVQRAKFDPSSDETLAQWIGVPMQDATGLTGATLRVVSHGDNGLAWIDFSYQAIDQATQMVEVKLDVHDVPGSLALTELPVSVTWHFDSGENISQVHIFDIAESGVPGDFDRDGVVTEADLVAFTEVFDASGLRADIDRNGVFDGADVSAFLSDYSSASE